MKRLATILLLGVLLAWASPAQAQLLFKKVKVNASQRVPELILIVKTDPDERKRAHAAEELRDYDMAAYTEIVPVLVDVLLHDKKHSVRLEALGSLVKIRPITATAGQAMEKAATEDDVLRVRLQAKAALTKYHLAGYSAKKTEKKASTVERPPAPSLPSPRVDESELPRRMPTGDPLPAVEGPSLFPR
ncbi:MAG: HEAT repeat domain-containing protein [Gemmataceae bacterium]|nr:HEAT repeat domain-containing protein [Gemmataceae bacterium]